MARGCLCLSINAKQTTSLGKEDISLFISLPSLFFVLFRGLTLILKAEGRQRDTDRGGRDRKRRADEKHLRDAGNIWFHIRRPREEIANRQNSYVLIYFII